MHRSLAKNRQARIRLDSTRAADGASKTKGHRMEGILKSRGRRILWVCEGFVRFAKYPLSMHCAYEMNNVHYFSVSLARTSISEFGSILIRFARGCLSLNAHMKRFQVQENLKL